MPGVCFEDNYVTVGGVLVPANKLQNTKVSEYEIVDSINAVGVLKVAWPKIIYEHAREKLIDIRIDREILTRPACEDFDSTYIEGREKKFPESDGDNEPSVLIGVSVKVFKTGFHGSLFVKSKLINAVHHHVFNRWGPYGIGRNNCAIKKDRQEILGFPLVEYSRTSQFKRFSSVSDSQVDYVSGFCFAITESSFVVVECKVGTTRIGENNDQVQRYLQAFSNVILQGVDFSYANKPLFEDADVNEDICFDWSSFNCGLSSRHSVEKDLISRGLAKPEDCFYVFSEADLESKDFLLFGADDQVSFLDEELLIPNQDFSGFAGKLEIPKSKCPGNTVEKHLETTLVENVDRLNAYYDQFH